MLFVAEMQRNLQPYSKQHHESVERYPKSRTKGNGCPTVNISLYRVVTCVWRVGDERNA